MRIFDFFRNRPQEPVSVSPTYLDGDGSFDFDVVGESNYQHVLEEIVGGRAEHGAAFYCDAELVPEPDNPCDRNAVAVRILERTVAYLSRDEACVYLARMHELGANPHARCDALICGGWDRGLRARGHFGVQLDIRWPVRVAS